MQKGLLPLLDPLYEAGLDTRMLSKFLADLAAWVQADTAVLAQSEERQRCPRVLAAFGPDAMDLLAVDAVSGEGLKDRRLETTALTRREEKSEEQAVGGPVRVEPFGDGNRVILAFRSVAGGSYILILAVGAEADGMDKAREASSVLFPHVARMLDLRARIGRSELVAELTTATLELLPFPFMVVEDDGYVILSNQIAETAIARGDGPQIENGKVQNLDAVLGLHAAGSRESKGADTGVFFRFRPGSSVAVRHGLIVPMVETGAASRSSRFRPRKLILFFEEPLRESTISTQALRDLFGLTPAEARLLGLIMTGRSVAEACEDLSISSNTAKTHMRNLLGKTECASQTDLVRLALRSPATHAAAGP